MIVQLRPTWNDLSIRCEIAGCHYTETFSERQQIKGLRSAILIHMLQKHGEVVDYLGTPEINAHV